MHRRFLTAFSLVFTLLVAAGCGGAGAGDTATDGGGEQSPASLAIVVEPTTIVSGGDGLATLTLFVKDALNRGLAYQDVEFATLDAGVVLQEVAARTDASGVATATLRVIDPALRVIEVFVRSGGLTDRVTVQVVAPTAVNGSAQALDAPGTAQSRLRLA